MKLFEVIPGNFFSVLCSKNRQIYYDALIIMHDMFKYELNIRVDDYLSSLISILEDRAFELEEDDEAQESSLTTSGKARLILNRFIKTGWIDKEFLDGSFVEIITPRSYAITFMKTLSELENNSSEEYNSLVFATFSGLKQAKTENESHMYEAILSAKANTEKLQYSLRTFYHGIRGFLRNIVDQQDVNLLLQNHFEEYKELSDRVYHPIKTMDSVHRYTIPIQNILTEILLDEDLMKNMLERAVSIKKYDNEDEAQEEINIAIDFILDAYQNLGDLIGEIDRKHSNYTKSSTEKIQYLMTADHTIKGKLGEILNTYSTLNDDKREQLACIMKKHISVNRQDFFDSQSLYHKNVRSRRIDKDPITIVNDNSFADLAEGFIVEQLKNRYSSGEILNFMENLFAKGITRIEAKDLQIEDDSDFILLILAVIRQNEKMMTYSVEMGTKQIFSNGYRIPDMVITRKGGTANVE